MADQPDTGRSARAIAAVWSFLTRPLVLALIGVAASYASGAYFYEKGKSDVVKDAIHEGRIAGIAQGEKDEQIAFQKNLPALIENRYPGALKNARDLGHQEGLSEGLKKGRSDGYDVGYAAGKDAGEQDGFGRGKADGFHAGVQQGRKEAVAECTLQHQAERNWQIYANEVGRMGDWADSLERERGNRELEAQLVSETRGVVEAAKALRAAYTDQAAAFDSIVDEMAAALAATNYPRLRELARALRDSLKSKGELFLQANKRIVTAFEDLNR
jgi:hypothetical protein